ncbi:hypothetical protein [Brevundimonas diminuta]|uniref:hypothetical protein n=1 Tax=Brevundimonas diminuta TaxID=293 RepID=UPI003D01D98A
MSEYCQDRAILWLSRSFTAASGELRDVCVEMAFLYEQMSQLSDRLDQLAEGLDQGRSPSPERLPRL